jgi:radical SAM superfamily enzyme YgiQ (UPF0313 family)
MHVLLISTYELGHQPFGLASPAAWLAERGHQVACTDLAVESLDANQVHEADLVAFYLPMHTATRLAAKAMEKVRALNPEAHICCYGLYAPLNEAYLRGIGAGTILGGEFEAGLVSLLERLGAGSALQTEPLISLDRLQFRVPLRTGLPPYEKYGRLQIGERSKQTGYTEASRGCKHLCRHCPVVPVYQGSFRVVQPDVVLADIRQQVAAGAGPARRRVPVRHQRRGSGGRCGACEAGQRPHARRFYRGGASISIHRLDARAHLHSVHALDDARILSRVAECVA